MGVPTILVNDTSSERHHGCTRVMRTLKAHCAAHQLDIIETVPVHQTWRDRPGFDAALKRARLIVVNGEGSLHHGGEQAAELLAIAAAARAHGAPAVLINASWQSNPPDFVAMAGGFALIAVRESKSQKELRVSGVQSLLTPDLSLFESHRTAAVLRDDVLFTDSVVPDVAAQLARLRAAVGGREISIFEPQQHGDIIWRTRVAAARAASRPLTARLPAFVQNWPAGEAVDTDYRLLERIASARVLVTGRFHAACFALLTQTPLICTATNTHKIEGLLTDAGLEPWRLATPGAIDSHLITRAATLHRHEREALGDYLSSGRDATRRLFAEVAALC